MTTKHPIYRYEVTATSADSAVIDKFNAWMIEEHGADVLASAGCQEYRLYKISESESKAEYLFDNEQAFAAYEATAATKLRARGKEVFAGDNIVFSRSSSLLLAAKTNN